MAAIDAATNLANLASASQLAAQPIQITITADQLNAAGIDPNSTWLTYGYTDSGWAYQTTLDMIPPTAWTQDERVQFLKNFCAQILMYPQSFSDQTIASAQAISTQLTGNTLGFLSDSDSATIFVNTLGTTALNAGQRAADLGNGLLNLMSAVGTAASAAASGVKAASPLLDNSISGTVLIVGALVLIFMTVRDNTKIIGSTVARGFGSAKGGKG